MTFNRRDLFKAIPVLAGISALWFKKPAAIEPPTYYSPGTLGKLFRKTPLLDPVAYYNRRAVETVFRKSPFVCRMNARSLPFYSGKSIQFVAYKLSDTTDKA